MAYTDWPWNQYPEYVNGPAYLLHGSAVLPLLAACQTTPMMPFEDIYITGLCAERASVKRRFSTGTTRWIFSIYLFISNGIQATCVANIESLVF